MVALTTFEDLDTFLKEDVLKGIKEIKRMFNVWLKIKSSPIISKDSIKSEIDKLEVNQTFPIYLKSQNACLSINRIENNEFVVSSFQASVTNKQVNNKSNDFTAVYPFTCFLVSYPVKIKTRSFADLLADLANNKFDMSIFRKKEISIYVDDVTSLDETAQSNFCYIKYI